MPPDETNKGERKRIRAAAKIERKLKRRHKREKAKMKLNRVVEQLGFVTRTLVAHIDEANRRNDEANRRYDEANRGHQSVVLTTQLPIVAGIIYKEIFRIGMSRTQTNVSFGDRRQNLLLSRVEQYADFGMHTANEMRKFVATVSSRSTRLMMY